MVVSRKSVTKLAARHGVASNPLLRLLPPLALRLTTISSTHEFADIVDANMKVDKARWYADNQS